MTILRMLLSLCDLDSKYGFYGVCAGPIILVLISGWMLIADFGALENPVTLDVAIQSAEEDIKRTKEEMPHASLASFYDYHDGASESRMILRTAISKDIFWAPSRAVIWTSVAALACLICGAAVGVRYVTKNAGVTLPADLEKISDMLRRAAQVTTFICFAFVLFGLYSLGLWPLVKSIIESSKW